MLVLTRKLQQQIKIGEQITVTILRVKGQTVRVGIDAPRDVRVIRGELPREGDASAVESTIIETTLTITDEDEESTEAADDSVLPRGERNEASASPDRAVLSPRAPLPHSSASLRLPQRKRFSRTSNPPLRVAHQPSSTLAK